MLTYCNIHVDTRCLESSRSVVPFRAALRPLSRVPLAIPDRPYPSLRMEKFVRIARRTKFTRFWLNLLEFCSEIRKAENGDEDGILFGSETIFFFRTSEKQKMEMEKENKYDTTKTF